MKTHLLEIENAARHRLKILLPKVSEVAGATEELKATDPLKWVSLMNACKAQVEEVILGELICG